MTEDLVTVGTVAAAVAAGLVTGILLAFSTSVMPALARRPDAEAPRVMQAMNATIQNPLFGLLFGGAMLLSAALAVTAPFTTDETHAGLRGLGAALYVVGVFGQTMAVNVPMNLALDRVDPATEAGAAFWGQYLRRWTAWNHVRSLAGAAATTLLVVSLV